MFSTSCRALAEVTTENEGAEQLLKKPDEVEAQVDGELVIFNSTADVLFSPSTSRLVLTFSSGVQKVELYVDDGDLFWTGLVDEKKEGFIGYNNGTGDPGENPTWGAGLSPAGTNYEGSLVISVDTNEGPGGRLTGSFSGELNALQGSGFDPVSITDGAFDIFFDETMGRRSR